MTLTRWTPEELDRRIASGKRVIVEFRSDTCSQCGPQERVIERVSEQFLDEIDCGSIDAAQHPEPSERFGVRGLPSIGAFANGERVFMETRFRSASHLRGILRRLTHAEVEIREQA